MGCAFLALRASDDGFDLSALAQVAGRYSPVVAEQHDSWLSGDGRTRLDAWAVHGEAARGAFFAGGADSALAYSGWIQEVESWPLDRSVAANVLQASQSLGFEALFDERCGEYAVLRAGADGDLRGASDFLGGQHLYYGERGGLIAVSNRAFMVAAALDGTRLPAIDPLRLSWLMSGVRAMFGGDTLFKDVRLLSGEELLVVDRGGLRLALRSPERERATATDWDAHFAELGDRMRQIQRLPGVRFRQTLTGGKDSRLLFAALVASGAIEALDDCFIEAEPGHPDADLALHLAGHYGVEVEVFKAARADHPIFDLLELHNFQSEAAFHAYDTKGSSVRPRQGVINGHYGEIYKSHLQLRFLAGWPVVRASYGSRRFVDKWGLLTDRAAAHVRGHLLDAAERWQAEGTPLSDVHDRWHRECRMHRWLGQALQHDAIGELSFNPLPSPHLLRRYKRLPPHERKLHRVHFELIRRADDWLWRQPFANDRWAPHLPLGHGRPEPPLKRQFFDILPQFRQWQQGQAEMAHFLLDPQDDGFFDIVDRRALEERLAQARAKPTLRPVEQMLGCAGMRAALQGITPRPMAMAPVGD